MKDRLSNTQTKPSDWIERHFYVTRPFDLETGNILPPGPIRMAPHQKRIIDEALSRDETGKLKYSTVIYSAPKKSGKSALASAVAMYMATNVRDANVYCLANDGKGASDRLFGPINKCIRLHKNLGGEYGNVRVIEHQSTIKFHNFSQIEAIPCDASGEAGSEPTMVAFSELWGFDSKAKRRLFTEMTIPPTLYGHAIRWVESYAGFIGVSDLLWELFNTGTKQGQPHSDFLDLRGLDGEPVVYVNEAAKMFCYWDTVARMIWQSDEYYQQEALILEPHEFDRIHKNQWVTHVGTFIQPAWWTACVDNDVDPSIFENSTIPVIVAVDAAVTSDCAAIVVVGRHPLFPASGALVLETIIVEPPRGGAINIERDIGWNLRKLFKRYNVVCVAYDPYQMESTIQNYQRGLVQVQPEEVAGMSELEKDEYISQETRNAQKWYYNFSQHTARSLADKRLYDMVVQRLVRWSPRDMSDTVDRGQPQSLQKHITQAGVKDSGEKMRLVKLSNTTKIDAAVALAMALDRCMTLDIGNNYADMDTAIRLLQQGSIDLDQFMARMAALRKSNGLRQ